MFLYPSGPPQFQGSIADDMVIVTPMFKMDSGEINGYLNWMLFHYQVFGYLKMEHVF